MIYLFCGEDTKSKHSSYGKFMRSKPTEAEVFFIGKNDFNKMEVESFYSGSGLFFNKCIVVFTNIFEKEDNLNFVLEKMNLISESQNDFLFLEGKLNKTILDAFKKVNSEINIFELPKEKKEKFDSFLLANAFQNKDKLKLWVYYRQAIKEEVSLEELVGVLFWKIKDMLLKNTFNKFSEHELQEFARKLSCILPETRRVGQDTEVVLEQFLLEVF